MYASPLASGGRVTWAAGSVPPRVRTSIPEPSSQATREPSPLKEGTAFCARPAGCSGAAGEAWPPPRSTIRTPGVPEKGTASVVVSEPAEGPAPTLAPRGFTPGRLRPPPGRAGGTGACGAGVTGLAAGAGPTTT